MRQQFTLGHRGWKGDPPYRIRRRLLAAHDRLGAQGFERMLALLEAGDPTGEVAAAYLAKELLREMYATTEIAEAHHRLDAFHQHAVTPMCASSPACLAPSAAGSPRSSLGTPPR